MRRAGPRPALPTCEKHTPMKRSKPFRLTPPDPSEDQFQAAVADMLDYAFAGKPVTFSHFPSGGYYLTPAARARLKRLGLRAGFPDLVILWRPARQLWLELKTLKGQLSDAQESRLEIFRLLEVPVRVCRTETDVLAALREFDVPMNTMHFDTMEFHYGLKEPKGRSPPQFKEGSAAA